MWDGISERNRGTGKEEGDGIWGANRTRMGGGKRIVNRKIRGKDYPLKLTPDIFPQ